MNLLHFSVTKPYQKPENVCHISRWEILETHIFLELFCEKGFHLLLKFLSFANNEKYQRTETGCNCDNCGLCCTVSSITILGLTSEGFSDQKVCYGVRFKAEP
jgi:hypothetical protein